jgi:4-amino-4-deoxy-L-arabinose transferase-like glycosyltransferase
MLRRYEIWMFKKKLTIFLEKGSPQKTILWLVLLFAGLYLFYLGVPSLWDGDESIYVEISHQMLDRSDLIAPYFNYNELRFDKPPLNAWINVLFFKIFGMNEFASRFGSALFGLLGIILVYLFGRRLFNQKIGLLAALMMGTSFMYFIETQMALIDTTLTFFITLILYFFYRGYMEAKPRFYLWMGVAIGLGILTKGPVALLLTGAVGFIFWIYCSITRQKKWRDLFCWQLLGGFLIGLVICVPWYVVMWLRFGAEFLWAHFGFHMWTRFLKPIEDHGGSQWYYNFYYVLVIMVGFFPWSANLFHSLKMALKRRLEPEIFFGLVWIGVVFIFFTIAQTKIPGYIMPLLPPLVLLTGNWWAKVFSDSQLKPKLWIGNLVLLLIALLCLIIMVALRSQVPAGYENAFRLIIILPISVIAASLISLILYFRNHNPKSFFNVSFILSYLALIVFLVVFMPVVQTFHPVKHLAPELKKRIKVEDKLAIYTAGSFTAPFYVEHKFSAYWDDSSLGNALKDPVKVFAIVDEKTLPYLKEHQIFYIILDHWEHSYLIVNQPE